MIISNSTAPRFIKIVAVLVFLPLLIVVLVTMGQDIRRFYKRRAARAENRMINRTLNRLLRDGEKSYQIDSLNQLDIEGSIRLPIYGYLFSRMVIIERDESEYWNNGAVDITMRFYHFSPLASYALTGTSILLVRNGSVVTHDSEKDKRALRGKTKLDPDYYHADDNDMRIVREHLDALSSYVQLETDHE